MSGCGSGHRIKAKQRAIKGGKFSPVLWGWESEIKWNKSTSEKQLRLLCVT